MTIIFKNLILNFVKKNILLNFTKDETLITPRIIYLAKKK
jgi:hypothetical protein